MLADDIAKEIVTKKKIVFSHTSATIGAEISQYATGAVVSQSPLSHLPVVEL